MIQPKKSSRICRQLLTFQYLQNCPGSLARIPRLENTSGRGKCCRKQKQKRSCNPRARSILTDPEKEQYILSVAQTLSSKDIDDIIEKTAKAYQNAKDVQSAFMKATVGLLVGTQYNNTQFSRRIKPIVRVNILYFWAGLEEEGLISDRLSIPLSRNIAQYGDSEFHH